MSDGPNKCQRHARQKGRDRRPGNVAPGQVMCGSIQCDQFILMKAVLTVGKDLQENALPAPAKSEPQYHSR